MISNLMRQTCVDLVSPWRDDYAKYIRRSRTTGYEGWTLCHALLCLLLAMMRVPAMTVEANTDLPGGTIRPDGLPQIWKPTKDHPLPMFRQIEFMQSGQGGLNNIMWTVGRAIHSGCKQGRHDLLERVPLVQNGSLPLAFPIVILPPLNADLQSEELKPHKHQYSELFDLEHQLELSIKYRNCFITDRRTYRHLRKKGLLYSLGTNEILKNSKRGMLAAFKGLSQHRVYHGLEMSERLLQLYYNPCVAKMKEAFHPGEPRYAAVHMRVEDDWVPFCQEKEIRFKHSPEYRACFGAAEIAETFMNTPALREHKNILMLYAADNFTPDLEGRPDSMKPDPMKVWPSDVAVANPILLNCFAEDEHAGDKPGPTYTERSIVSMFMAANAQLFMSDWHSTFRKGVNMIRGTSRAKSGAVGKTSYIYNVFRNETRVAKPDPFADGVEGFVEGRGGQGEWIHDVVNSVMREVGVTTPREKLQKKRQLQQQRTSKSKVSVKNSSSRDYSSRDYSSSPRRSAHRSAEGVEGFDVEGRGGQEKWIQDVVKSVMREVSGTTPREKLQKKLQQQRRKSKSKYGKTSSRIEVSGKNSSSRDSSSPHRSARQLHHRYRHNSKGPRKGS